MIQPNAFMTHRIIADKAGKWDESISPAPDEDGEYFCRIILTASAIIYTPAPKSKMKEAPFEVHLRGDNRWVKLSGLLL